MKLAPPQQWWSPLGLLGDLIKTRPFNDLLFIETPCPLKHHVLMPSVDSFQCSAGYVRFLQRSFSKTPLPHTHAHTHMQPQACKSISLTLTIKLNDVMSMLPSWSLHWRPMQGISPCLSSHSATLPETHLTLQRCLFTSTLPFAACFLFVSLVCYTYCVVISSIVRT